MGNNAVGLMGEGVQVFPQALDDLIKGSHPGEITEVLGLMSCRLEPPI